METVLIRTPWEPLHLGFRKIASFEPLSLEYLATAVRDMCNVTLWDLWYQSECEMFEKFEKSPPDIIAMSVATVHIYSVIRIAAKLKKINPKSVVIIGGEAFLFPGYFKNSSVDLIAVGAGGGILRELVDRIKNNCDIRGIPGTIYLNDRESVYTPILEPVSLDSYGLPDRKINSHLRSNFHMYHFKPLASMVMSQGCWNRCNFCSTWLKNGSGKYNVRPLDMILKDFNSIEESWIFLVDDDTFGKGNNVSQFLGEIEKTNHKKQFMVEATSDDIINNSKTVEKWAENGLRHVLIGLESPFEEDLTSVSKAATLAQNIEAINILRKNGVDVIASFILFPHWEKRHFEGLLNFVRNNRLFFVHYQALTPMPGTILFRDSFQDIEFHNLDMYDMEHMVMKTKLPLKKWYNYRFWLNFKTLLFHRGFDSQVKRSLPFNPLHFLHRATLYLHWRLFNSIKHHEISAPDWQINDPDHIMGIGPVENLLNFNHLSTKNNI